MFLNTAITTNTTEVEFIKYLVQRLTEIKGITVEVPTEFESFDEYITDQFTNTTSGSPQFTLQFWGVNIIFTRNNKSNTAANSYSISTNINGNIATLNFCSGISLPSTSISVRSFKVCVAGNDNVIALYMGSCDTTNNISPFTLSAVGLNVSGGMTAYAISLSSGTKAITTPFTLSNGSSMSKSDRCKYLYDASDSTNIEVIKSKVFLASNSTSIFYHSSDLWDCSTVPEEAEMVIEGNKYFSLDSHTLIEV